MAVTENHTTFNQAQAAARSDVVADAIRNATPSSSGLTGLDYGCGPGHIGLRLADHFEQVILADCDPEALAQAKAVAALSNATVISLDLVRDPPPPDLRADVVFSCLSWHHIRDLDRLIDALPALAPDGQLFVAEMDPDAGAYHAELPDFDGWHGFDRNDLASRLTRHAYTGITTAQLGRWQKWIAGDLATISVFMIHARIPKV